MAFMRITKWGRHTLSVSVFVLNRCPVRTLGSLQLNVKADKRGLVLFFGLAYAIAWSLWLPLVLSQNGVGVLRVHLPLAAGIPGAFGPCVAAYIAQKWSRGNWRAVDWIQGWRRAWVGMLLAPFLLLLGQVVIPVLFLSQAPAVELHWGALLKYPLWLLYPGTLLTSPLGEEPGWRGYALPKLQGMMGPFWATMILGVLWAGWHLPLFLIKGWTSASIPVFALFMIAYSTIITFVVNASGNSVLVAVIAHSAANTCSSFVGELLAGVPTRQEAPVVLVMALSLLGVGALLVVFTHGRLGKLTAANEGDDTPEGSAQDAEQSTCSEPGDDAVIDNRGSGAPEH